MGDAPTPSALFFPQLRSADQSSATTHRLHSTRPQSLGSERSDLTAVTPRTGRQRYHLRPVSLRDPCLSPPLSLSLSRSPCPCLSRSSYLDERCRSVTLRFTKPRMILLRYSPGTKVDCYGAPYIPEGQWPCENCTVSPENLVLRIHNEE